MHRTLLLLALAMALLPSSAWACSCGGARNALEALGASAIFRGQVVRIELAHASGDDSRDYDHTEVEFLVTRVWRGRVAKRTVVITNVGTSDCGLEVVVWQEYIVPVYETDDGALYSGLCSGVERVGRAGATLAGLGPGYAPSKARVELASAHPSWRMILIAHAALSLVVLLFVGWRVRGGGVSAT